MKGKSKLVYFVLLPTLLLVVAYYFFDGTGLVSLRLDKSRLKEDYALIDKINVLQDSFSQSNNGPVVKIIEPKDKSSYTWETRLTYEIIVSDKEDGESKYGEINQNEVLLKVEYLGSTDKSTEGDKNVQDDSQGLVRILTSNCINCHKFEGKLIGPSFYEISKHYDSTQSNLQMMATRVRDGSSGVWGNTAMPSHPELSNQEIKEMVQWIMKNAGRSNIQYYTGTEGSIKLKLPTDSEKNISFILTAEYTDHGLDGSQKLKGQDSVVIYSK